MPYKDKEKQREYQRTWIATNKLVWFLANGPCVNCGSYDNLELDHIDPTQKVDHKVWSWAEDRRNKELEKCQVLCKSCHRIKTNKEITRPLEHGVNTYKGRHCRCKICCDAHSEYQRKWRSRATKSRKDN